MLVVQGGDAYPTFPTSTDQQAAAAELQAALDAAATTQEVRGVP